MRVIVIIPARGGSKSLPRKNIIPLNGKPLISYSIDYSLKCELVNNTIVSTDDKEIADISLALGAEIPFMRPADLAGDLIEDYAVLRHCLDFFDSKGLVFDYYILLRPTSPLRQEGLIEKGLELLENNLKATSVRAVSLTNQHPYRTWIQKGDFIQSSIDKHGLKEPYNIPRQLLPKSFFQTGDIEIVRRDTILSGSVSGQFVLPLIIDNYVDIDNSNDLRLAESFFLKK